MFGRSTFNTVPSQGMTRPVLGGLSTQAQQPIQQQQQQMRAPPSIQVPEVPSDSISCLRFSPTGCPITLLGATSWDGTVRLWEVKVSAGTVSPYGMQNAGAPLLTMCLSAQGQVFYGGVDRKVTMWDLSSGAAPTQVAEHTLAVTSVQYMTNCGQHATLLASSSWDGSVRFWDLRSPQPVKVEDFGAPVFALDGQSSSPMLTIALGRVVVVYNMNTMTRFQEVPINPLCKFQIKTITNWPSQDAYAVGTTEGRVAVHSIAQSSSKYACAFKAQSEEVKQTNGVSKHTMYMCNVVKQIPSAPHSLLTAGGDGRFSVFSVTDRTRVFQSDQMKSPTGVPIPISAGDISCDGTLLALGYSYDWGMGKEEYDPNAPRSIYLMSIPQEWKKG